jgi:hypothetical protein
MTVVRPSLFQSVYDRAESQFAELDAAYSRLPSTTCARKTDCCALLPQMTLAEACRLAARIREWPDEERRDVVVRLVEYFYLNAVRIVGCPFLGEASCLAYPGRPFGCRAYGLWSSESYRRQSRTAAEGKKAVNKAWAGLGVELPRMVLEHHPPYCREVRVEAGRKITDDELDAVNRKISELDRSLEPASNEFGRKFGSDLSFVYAAELSGFEAALKNKVAVVREYLELGRSPSLDYLLDKLRTEMGK